MASKSFNLGYTFKFGGTDTNVIIYKIEDINISSNYYKCKQISTDNDFPLQIYLTSTQLNNVTKYRQSVPLAAKYRKGTEFTMNGSEDIFSIYAINEKYGYYQCIDNNNNKNTIYLSFSQLNFVWIVSIVSAEESKESKEEIFNQERDRTTTYTLAEEQSQTKTKTKEKNNKEIDYKKMLPYFTDWIGREELSVLNQNDYKNNPSGYLKAIRNKYNIQHQRDNINNINDNENNSNGYTLRPWIEGKMEKLMAETGFLGTEKWKTRLFRLYDEALVWFDDSPSFFDKIINIKNKKDFEYMTPFGILPLAMITGLKTADIESMKEINGITVTENELLRLELQIGDEGVIILKCCDFNQRIKWYECLHSAIFTVKRPLFIKDKDLWRIAEPKVNENTTTKFKRQITREDILGNDRKRRQGMHVRMGQSIAFKVTELKSTFATAQGQQSPSLSHASNESIELPDVTESNTLKNTHSNSIKVL